MKEGFDKLMEKAKQMQDQMKDIQKQIAEITIIGESGGGLVKVTMDGSHACRKVQISPTLMGEDDEDMLEDLVAAAINDAAQKIEKATKEAMVGIAKNMKLPEGFDGSEGGTVD